MQDQFSEVLLYAKGVVRNKWVITIVAWFICVGGWVFVYQMPDVYKSTARVHVDTRTMLRPLLRGLAVQTDVRGLVAIMKKLMFTQHNMLKVAELAGMEVEQSSEGKTHSLVNKLKNNVKITGGRGEIFSITYESSDPQNAKRVVQAVLTVFSEQTQQSTLTDVDSAQRFIDNQIKEYEQRLRNAESTKENFKRINIGLLPGQAGEGQVDEIRKIRQKSESVKLKLSEILSRRQVLQRQLAEALESGEEWGLTEIVENNSVVEDARITELKKRKDEILLKYTKNHPNIATIENEILALQSRKDENKRLSESSDDSFFSSYQAMSNPYVQTIKIAVNNIDVEIASLKARLHSYKIKLQKEDDQFNLRLSIETEMQSLNRDYETIKKNYLALIDRREQATMSSKVDSQVSALKFKIADPANMPLTPSAPNRLLLYTASLVIGFVVGIAISLLIVILRPTFIDAKQLTQLAGIPVLGVVTEVVHKTQVAKNKIRLLKYIFANVFLLVIYSSVMMYEIMS